MKGVIFMEWTKSDWQVEDNFSISAPRVDGEIGRVTIAGMKGFEYFSRLLGNKKAKETLMANARIMSNSPVMFDFIHAIYEALQSDDDPRYWNFINWAERIIARVKGQNEPVF